MLPGPDYIISCPYCGEHVRKQSLISANTFGATFWSDGFMIAPMYPDLPLVVRCRNCRGFYNANTARVVREIPLNGTYDSGQNAIYIEHLKPEDYPEVLASPLALNTDIERYLRTRYWWEMNHSHRFHGKSKFRFAVRKKQYVENLLALLGLLDENQMLMKAEILRNLKRFNECIEILNTNCEEEDIVRQMLSHANKHNAKIFKLK